MQHPRDRVRSLHVSFHDGASDIRAARNVVGQELARSGWSPSDIDRVRLVVSELAANAVLHARTHFELRCDIDDTARIEVVDWSPGHLPSVREIQPEQPGGLGMRLVGELADEWGVERHDDRKVVWCVLCRSRSAADPSGGGDGPDGSDSGRRAHAPAR